MREAFKLNCLPLACILLLLVCVMSQLQDGPYAEVGGYVDDGGGYVDDGGDFGGDDGGGWD